ncbi:MAG: 1-deoxy-D-xylulose-5-phosphate synthase [Gemmataceae bacterium]|nr:1-deoxy-D-xylulose-5-phosphate synthase [Gemmataceae bacterium]MCI0742956.1 1-deoxy-D-xylulose-5-phosphate synthase [Gemmataceae bacterium]
MILPTIKAPADLRKLNDAELHQLAHEMRDELIRVLSIRPAHFASNLGVVELCLALHLTFDFTKDRLIWDTGHQIYPHKLITGRYDRFESIRTKGGLMGYPNPEESPFDLFMTGHAGCATACALGLKIADELLGHPERHSVAVVGDGAFPSGIVFEALNNAGHLKRKFLVILNDNKMSICPRVGALATCFDRARLTNIYQGSKRNLKKILNKIPILGGMASHALDQMRDGLKALLTGGMLFEELGFHYVGPIDGHDLNGLRSWLRKVKDHNGPVLLHVLTVKGQGVPQASDDPVTFHTPPVFEKVGPDRTIVSLKRGGSKAYTDAASSAIYQVLQDNPRVTVMTAAMCQGNKLEKVRTDFPDRFFDVGICESHAVAFAAGQAKAGLRPIVDVYSTFLQRAFDQIFQEVTLQNLPVTFCLDRAGLTGPDGPTHHGCFDITYMRLFPNMVVMAPGDELDVAPMLRFALQHDGPASMRYPKAGVEKVERGHAPIELGQAEIHEWGTDGTILVFGSLFLTCVKAAEKLRQEGIEIGVVNARFAKPLDRATVLRAVEETPLVVTVEEGTLEGGFGSAVLEAVHSAGLDTRHIIRLGIPDRFIEHGERGELLADLGLDVEGICRTIRQALEKRTESRAWALGN